MLASTYLTGGTKNEQYLLEDIVIESLKTYGQIMHYIPRKIISLDQILGEDRLSQFTDQYPIEMYLENVSGFEGQGAFVQKFGLMMEQSATLVVSRRRWNQLIGRFGQTNLPNRPSEGDLIYFPLTKGLFEIKFVDHQDPFYQLGKLYVYKLQVELFQYSSEIIETGNADIDVFESLKTHSTDTDRSFNNAVMKVNLTNGGTGYTTASATVSSSSGYGCELAVVLNAGVITAINVVNGGAQYQPNDPVIITGNGANAAATADVYVNIDNVGNFGDNNKFKTQGAAIMFDNNNPFGDVV